MSQTLTSAAFLRNAELGTAPLALPFPMTYFPTAVMHSFNAAGSVTTGGGLRFAPQ